MDLEALRKAALQTRRTKKQDVDTQLKVNLNETKEISEPDIDTGREVSKEQEIVQINGTSPILPVEVAPIVQEEKVVANSPEQPNNLEISVDESLTVGSEGNEEVSRVEEQVEITPIDITENTESDKDREDGELVEDLNPPVIDDIEKPTENSKLKKETGDEYAALLDDYQRCLERQSSKKSKVDKRKLKGKRKEEQQGRFAKDSRLYPELVGPFRGTFLRNNGRHPYFPMNHFMHGGLNRFRGPNRMREDHEPFRPSLEMASGPYPFRRNSNEYPVRVDLQPTWTGNPVFRNESDATNRPMSLNDLAPLLANALTQLQNNQHMLPRPNTNTQHSVAPPATDDASNTNHQYRNEYHLSGEPDTAFLLAKQITQELVNIGLSAQSIVSHGVSQELVDACLAEPKRSENETSIEKNPPVATDTHTSNLSSDNFENQQNDGDDMELDDSDESVRNHILSNTWVTVRNKDEERFGSVSARASSNESLTLASKRGSKDPYRPVPRYYREKRKVFVPDRPMRYILVSDSEDENEHPSSEPKSAGEKLDQSVVHELAAKERQITALRESIARKEAEKRLSKEPISAPCTPPITTVDQPELIKQPASTLSQSDKNALTPDSSNANDELVKKIESEVIIRQNYMSLVESELVEEVNELEEVQAQIQDFDNKVSENEEAIAQYTSEIAALQSKIEGIRKQTELVSHKKLVIISRASKLQEKIQSGRNSVSEIQKQISKNQKRLAKLRRIPTPTKAQRHTEHVVSKNTPSNDLPAKPLAPNSSALAPSSFNLESESCAPGKTIDRQPENSNALLLKAEMNRRLNQQIQSIDPPSSKSYMDVDPVSAEQTANQPLDRLQVVDHTQSNIDESDGHKQAQKIQKTNNKQPHLSKRSSIKESKVIEAIEPLRKSVPYSEKSRKLSELDKKVKAIHKEQQALAEILTKHKARSKAPQSLRYAKLQTFMETGKLTATGKNDLRFSTLHSFLEATVWNTQKTIEPLHVLSDFLQSADSVALPTDLTTRFTQVKLNEVGNSRRIILRDKQAEPDTRLSLYTTYRSPLRAFKASLLSPRLSNHVSSKSRNSPFCYQIDPFQKICMYEVAGGECNDDTCTSQHFRDVQLTDDDYLVSLISDDVTNEPGAYSKYLGELHSKLSELKDIQKLDVHLLEEIIVQTKLSYLNGKESSFGPVSSSLSSNALAEAHQSGAAQHKNIKYSSIDFTERDLAQIAKPFTVEWIYKNYGEQASETSFPNLELNQGEAQLEDLHDHSLLKSEQSWVEYAVSLLPDLSKVKASDPVCNVDKSLQILSLALERYSSSEFLWNFYFELYIYIRGDGLDEIRKMFETAIKLNMRSALIWWRYYQWEPEAEKRLTVLKRMLSRFMLDKNSFLDQEQLSKLILDIVIQIAQTLIYMEGASAALKFFSRYLKLSEIADLEDLLFGNPTSEEHSTVDMIINDTLVFQKMMIPDITIAWLVYLHLFWFESLPSLFYDYPYEYISKPQLFVLRWNENPKPEAIVIEETKLILKNLIQSRISLHRYSLVALCRNYAALINLPSQDTVGTFDEILEQTLQNHSHPELWDIKADFLMDGQDFKAAEKVLTQAINECQSFALCNRYVRLKLLQNDKDGLLETLSRSLELCYGDFNSSSSEDLLGMYRSLLDISFSTPSILPKSTVSIPLVSQNFHLWANFLILSYALDTTESYVRNLEYTLTKLQDIDERSLFANEFIRYNLGVRFSDSHRSLPISTFVNTLNQTLKHLLVSESVPYISHSEPSTSLLKIRPLKVWTLFRV
ncbi:Zinc finger C3H1 domain-containing protein, variant 2 [Basidiobolus ranarum]|uniref:Zinc finger C3H1 domain-containing protein, variant 2 n=1 Tax=Basidiobolus ranarum TaxID=34480 RepID=A0ABR2WY93_9FUNG